MMNRSDDRPARILGLQRGGGDVWMLAFILVVFILMIYVPSVWTWLVRGVIAFVGVALFRLLQSGHSNRGHTRSISVGPVGWLVLFVWLGVWIAVLLRLQVARRWIDLLFIAPIVVMLAMLFFLIYGRPKGGRQAH